MSQSLVYSSRTWLIEPLAISDDTIYVDNINNITNTIVQSATAPVAVAGVMSVGLYANKNTIVNIVVYNNTTSTVISSSHYTLVVVDTVPTLRITTGAWIATGNSLTITTIDGNLIYINGEQIKFGSVNTTDNTLSNLSRGQNVTPAEYLIAKYTEVWGLLPKNKMNNVGYVNTWNSYNYNTVIGDPLQISTTSEALFLTNNKYIVPFPIISPIPQTTTSTTTAAPTTYSFAISPTTWIGNISGPASTTTTTTTTVAPSTTTTTTSAPATTTTTTLAPGLTTTTTTSAPTTTTTTTSAPTTTTTTTSAPGTTTTTTSTSTSTTTTSTSTSTTTTTASPGTAGFTGSPFSAPYYYENSTGADPPIPSVTLNLTFTNQGVVSILDTTGDPGIAVSNLPIQWFTPTGGGIGGSYDIRITSMSGTCTGGSRAYYIVFGTGPTGQDPNTFTTPTTWYALSSSQTVTVGIGSAPIVGCGTNITFTVEIAPSGDHSSPITGVFTLNIGTS